MRTRFCSFIQSPDANEGALALSKYSTERSPVTALLFEAKRKVALPVVRIEEGLPHEIMNSGKVREGADRAGRSLQE
jgi:hypothetical protein